MRFSGLMLNEFWIPIIHISQEQKLYILEYMSKKRRIEKLLCIQFKKIIVGKNEAIDIVSGFYLCKKKEVDLTSCFIRSFQASFKTNV